MSQAIKIYRKDYTQSPYLISNTNLEFEFFDDCVLVYASIDFYQNLDNIDDKLFLNGEELELVKITINDKKPNYKLDENGLWLYDLPKKWNLKTTVKIYPQNNTSLNGLYRSGTMFCTQCEAQGFRKITYYLDRPDILSIWSVKIIADKNQYPTQLSNGNFDDEIWSDPYPKPCYLFALVVGNLAKNSATWTTKSGKIVNLAIWTENHNIDKTAFAMTSLQKSMQWDETRFNLEYDLEIYNIVAVDDFNMGAMENKSLNVFNSSLVLANPQTATDKNYLDIEAVIGHEYFHNWTGNRITCKDWFQLSLKEGLTVFRDQEFSSDIRNRDIKRLDDVNYLRTHQFAEDESSLSHPVRPESYIAMDNFYTLTVYEKGSEIVRMLHTILGEVGFQKLMNEYIAKFDGKAVSIDDFVECAHLQNQEQFMLWYSQAGTPQIEIKNDNNQITITQNDARLTPIKYGILNNDGMEIDSGVLLLKSQINHFDFSKLGKNLHFSWLRDFSAPVKLKDNLNLEQRLFLIINDNNSFVRFDNMQYLYNIAIFKEDKHIFTAFDYLISTNIENGILTKLLEVPSEKSLHAQVKEIDIADIFQKREKLILQIANKYQDFFASKYQELQDKYEFNTKAIYQRELKNLCLFYLSKTNNYTYAYSQFKSADCMTDKLFAFNILLNSSDYFAEIKSSFYTQYKNDSLVLNKWFFAVANSSKTTDDDIKKLLQHSDFNLKNPNKVRSLIGGWTSNFINFHNKQGYEFLVNFIIKLDKINPQISARLAGNFSNYAKFSEKYQTEQLKAREIIKQAKGISPNLAEMLN